MDQRGTPKDDFKLASQLLGRPYYFSGKVVRGQQLGRTIGIPTANLWMPKQRLPVSGVYAVSCSIDGSSSRRHCKYGNPAYSRR